MPRAVLYTLLALATSTLIYAQVTMDDLGYPEPDWKTIEHGAWKESMIQVKNDQLFSNIQPGDNSATVCEYTGPGKCNTQIGWITAAHNITKDFFEDERTNYLMRFQLYGACYKSTQYSFNKEAQYCASWWKDPFTGRKINVTNICYTMQVLEDDPFNPGQKYFRKYGCAHKFNGTQERFEQHQKWYQCYDFAPTSLEPCRAAAFSLNSDLDGPKLQRMFDFIQGPGAINCQGTFNNRKGEMNGMTERQYCEDFISSSALIYMKNNRGFDGTAAVPDNLDPVYFPPPPPSPPPPFPPPSPPAPPPIGFNRPSIDSFGNPTAPSPGNALTPAAPGATPDDGNAAPLPRQVAAAAALAAACAALFAM